MPKKSLKRIQFPAGGLNKNGSFRNVPPYTTQDCSNVRVRETIDKRARGGSRPGTGKAYFEQLGSGNPINMLNSVSYVEDDGFRVFTDTFDGTSLGSGWSTASWIGTPPPITETPVTGSSPEQVGAVRSDFSIDSSSAYEIAIWIEPYDGTHYGTYSIYARMNDTTPDCSASGYGVDCQLELSGTDGSYDGQIIVYDGDAGTTYDFTDSGDDTVSRAGWFKVEIDSGDVRCYWQGHTLIDQAITIGASGETSFGYGMNCTVAGGICLVSSFRLQYYDTSLANDDYKRTRLMAASNGSLYREAGYGSMEEVSTSLTLNSSDHLQATQRYQKLYIADYQQRINGTDGSCSSTTFDASGVADWTAYGIDADDDVVVISNGTGTVVNGTYKISSIAAGSITLASDPGTGNCAYRIERSPKVYDPADNSLSILTATTGQVPTGCKLICQYRDRIVLARAENAPHVWYMSRQGDPTDWDYSQTDAQRAVGGTGTSDPGILAEPITALAPHSNDYLVFGAESSLWVLRGDPAYGGQIDNLSYNVGIVGAQAWCRTPEGGTVFLSLDGLYYLSPSAQGEPQSISRELIPQALIGITSQEFRVLLSYDIEFRGIHIYLYSAESSNAVHYWFDWESKSFFPVSLPKTSEPASIYAYTSDLPGDSGVLLGCRDGYIREYRDGYEHDDGTSITSYCDFGPFRIDSDYSDGLLSELIGVVGEYSGTVDWSVYVDESHERVSRKTSAFDSGSWSRTTSGRQFTVRPRARGGSCIVSIANGESYRRWSMEQIIALLKTGGKERLP